MQPFASVRLTVNYPALWLLPCSLPTLKALLARLLAAAQNTEEGREISGLELQLVDDWAIAQANWRYLNARGPTNILSFPGGPDLPGTLLLSLDTFARECRLYAQQEAVHLMRLLSHGTAHLAGLEHGSRHALLESACLTALAQDPLLELGAFPL
ncbi:MAG: rRNA maturation RNase YbeY [Desulfovibrio sp.]|nr:rRNA maturation RNase YbeY [Desulfovibrio sp.]